MHPLVRSLAAATWLAAAAWPPAAAADPPPASAGVRPTAEQPGFPGLASDPNRGDSPPVIIFAAAGDRLTGTTQGGKLGVFDPSGATIGPGFGPAHGGYGTQFGLAAHPAKPWVLVANYQQHARNGTRVTVWDTADRKQVRDLDEGAAAAWLSNPAFDPAGKTVWLWEWYYRPPAGQPRNPNQPETVLRVWDADTGDEVRAVPAPAEVPEAVVPDLYGGSPEAHLLAFAPGGAWAAVVHGRRVCLLEAATGQVRADLGLMPARLPPADPSQRGRATGVAVAVSGDGRQVLVGCRDGVVRRWDVLAGRERPPLVGHKDAVRAVWCSADGRTARSISSDKLLTWDLSAAAAGWEPPGDPPPADRLAALAGQLGADDPAARYAAAETLAAHPAAAVEAVRAHVRPVPPVDKDRLAGLVADVYGTEYNARKRAMKELRQLGEPALAALTDPADHRHRYGEGPAAALIKDIRDKLDPAAAARAVRAVGVLERVASPEARRLLDELAAGAAGAAVTRAAQDAATRMTARPATAPPPPGLPGLWAELAAGDAARAHRAAVALAARPAEAVPLLRDNLLASPARAGLDLSRVAGLAADLGSDDFDAREAATRELAGYGRAAVPLLREAAATAASPEARRRLAELLRAPIDPAARPAALQAARAVEVLGWVGTADARAALEAAADGAADDAFREAAAGAARRAGR